MAAKTRADLVEEVARRFGNYRQLTASGGSTTTVVDADGLYEPDDYWVGHYAYIVTDAGGASAAPEGEERPVTDYVRSTATLTVDPAFSAAVASGDTYELLTARRADIVAAINAGVRAAGETWLVPTVDTSTVTIAEDDYDYNLPSGLVRLLTVAVRGGTDEAYRFVGGQQWWVSGTPGGPQVLLFDTLNGLEAGDTIRLEYLARPSELSSDSTSLGLGEPAERELVEFVIHWALYWLHDQVASRDVDAPGFRGHITQAQYHQERAERMRMAASRWHGRGTVRTPRWARHRG